jgi:hypothetical protein
MKHPEYILCAAIYVDTGKAEPRRRSYTYPKTGLVFAGWRHADCFLILEAWKEGLHPKKVEEIKAISHYSLRGRNQGFLTSKGRYVSRREGWEIAVSAGQVEARDGETYTLTSEDLY